MTSKARARRGTTGGAPSGAPTTGLAEADEPAAVTGEDGGRTTLTEAPEAGAAEEDRPGPGDAAPEAPAARGPRRRRRGATAAPVADTPGEADEDPADDDAEKAPRARTRGRRPAVPLVPLLAVVLVLLLAAIGWLLAPRLFAEESAVRTDSYVGVLQAARANVVDLTSFDHLTLDDDIQQARRVTTGDLREESVARLEEQRDALVQGQVVVNTEVVGAGVTRAGEEEATVLMVIQATTASAGQQGQVTRYRIEVEMTREDGRWLLSGITGR
ncbi:hypothetical protein [Blastococcus sp. SYSU D00820]